MAAAREDVYCTLLMSDAYLPGAAILAHSLRDCGTSKKLAILVTTDSLLPATLQELHHLYDYVLPVDKLATPRLDNLVRLNRLDLRFTFTKIALWRQEQFRRIVYIDCDVVALRAPDELFDLPADFAAAPDIGWPDCFNSGVMALTPNMGEYWALQTLASSGMSFDGADQGLLNEYYANRPWHRLSFVYNCTPSASYQYEPAYHHFKSSVTLVHFIGKDKPWTTGRQALHGGGTYRELLGRWWAVYDRHYKHALLAYRSSEKELETHTVRQYVYGEQTDAGWATAGLSAEEQGDSAQRSAPVPAIVVEAPISDSHPLETMEVPRHEPSPPVEPTFEAPQQNWDATRSEPPPESRPEAENFPTQQYQMSRDRGLFQAPDYKEPPKGMYYEVPTSKPRVHQEPTPIFPWETSDARSKATRVFADSYEPTPEPQRQPEVESEVPGQDQTRSSDASATTAAATSSQPWNQFTRSNAWDAVPSIDQYVRAVRDIQTRRGKVQVLHHTPDPVLSEVLEGDDLEKKVAKGREGRESLILTDFPSAVERPSLPVTPAPIHRPSFWGEERDEAGELPAAQGVPEQADWNPHERLEALRRTSIIASTELPLSPTREIPMREMPGTASIPPPPSTMSPPRHSPLASPPPAIEQPEVALPTSAEATPLSSKVQVV